MRKIAFLTFAGIAPLGCADDSLLAASPSALTAAAQDTSCEDPMSRADAGAPEVTYELADMCTNLPRWVVIKRDPQRGLCTRIVLTDGGGFRPRLSARTAPPGITIESALIAKLDACEPVGARSPNDFVQATDVVGTVSYRGGCDVDMDLTLHFPPTSSWAPATERFATHGPDDHNFVCSNRCAR